MSWNATMRRGRRFSLNIRSSRCSLPTTVWRLIRSVHWRRCYRRWGAIPPWRRMCPSRRARWAMVWAGSGPSSFARSMGAI